MSNYDRKDIVIMLPFIALLFGAYIHEGAHLMVASNLGLQMKSVTFLFIIPIKISPDWASVDITIGGLFMLGFVGCLFESLFYAILALRVREMSIMALGVLTYGVAEAFKIALMQKDFLMTELAGGFALFTMVAAALFIGRRLHREWIKEE